MWQNQRAQQFIKLYEFDFYIFAFVNEVTGKSIVEPDDKIEENKLTFYVRTSSGKTISIICVKKQNAASISDEVETRSAIPRGMTYLVHHGKVLNGKKTIEENNIDAEPTIEMSLRLLGGMDENAMKDSSETEEEREKRESWKKRVMASRWD